MSDSEQPSNILERFVGVLFGLVFGGAGLTMIYFLWAKNGFGAPPLFFRIFGTLFALIFVTAGATIFFGSFKRQSVRSRTSAIPQPTASTSGTGYTCPACGARLGAEADVSPKGDVKCGYCRKWFNVHG